MAWNTEDSTERAVYSGPSLAVGHAYSVEVWVPAEFPLLVHLLLRNLQVPTNG